VSITLSVSLGYPLPQKKIKITTNLYFIMLILIYI